MENCPQKIAPYINPNPNPNSNPEGEIVGGQFSGGQFYEAKFPVTDEA